MFYYVGFFLCAGDMDTPGIPTGIPGVTPGSPQLGEYLGTEIPILDIVCFMPQDSGNSILYNYKSLDR